MLKFTIGVVLVAFMSFCGYFLAGKYRKRCNFFTQFQEFNERFLCELSYAKRPLADFFNNYPYKGEFAVILHDFFVNIEAWRIDGWDILSMSNYDFLNKEEKNMIYDYFFMLGKGDSESQKSYFSSVKNAINNLQTKASNNQKRYGDLYIKIGFLCGLLVLILLI